MTTELEQQQQQQQKLEGRVTGLERDMQNMSQAVASLTDTVKTGFAETREMMASAARRQDERTSELHQRLDRQAEKSSERGKINWGVAVALCSLIWVVVIAVVTWGMSQATQVAVAQVKAEFMEGEIVQLDTMLQREMRLIDDTRKMEIAGLDTQLQREMRMLDDVSAERHNRQEDRLADHHFEIEKLHRTTDALIEDIADCRADRAQLSARMRASEKQQDRRWPQFIAGAEARGKLEQMVGSLRKSYDTLLSTIDAKSADRFTGNQGKAHEERIQALETFIRDHGTGANHTER